MLTSKQKRAIEMLTCGEGLTLKQIAERAGVSYTSLYRWQHEPEFIEFQEEVKKREIERWQSIIDVATASCKRLCENDNQRMVEFVMKNAGYNPTQKLEADVNATTVITVSIDGEDEDGDTTEAE